MTTPETPEIHDLKELEDFFNPALLLPIKGKEYTVKAVDAQTGLRLQNLLGVGLKAEAGGDISPQDIELVSDDEETDFFTTILGDTYQELVTDGISYKGLQFISSVVFIWTTQSFELAQEMWRTGGKAPAQNREQRRTATRTRTAAASTTPKRASASGTSTRKATAKAAPGGKSSPTGTPSSRTSKTSA